jgi:hypothetical protein
MTWGPVHKYLWKLLPNLDPSKAAGPDELKPKILKELAHNISPVLCLIFNKSLETGGVPTDWRTHMFHPFTRKVLSILLKNIDLYLLHGYVVKSWNMVAQS